MQINWSICYWLNYILSFYYEFIGSIVIFMEDPSISILTQDYSILLVCYFSSLSYIWFIFSTSASYVLYYMMGGFNLLKILLMQPTLHDNYMLLHLHRIWSIFYTLIPIDCSLSTIIIVSSVSPGCMLFWICLTSIKIWDYLLKSLISR